MVVAVPREPADERRVALVPDQVRRLTERGLAVRVEAAAGKAAGFPDAAYTEAGAVVVGSDAALRDGAGVLVRVGAPSREQVAELPPGIVLIGMLQPLSSPELVRTLAARRVSALAMELVPRITRAQRMDALSSQATVAGYRAALLAAVELPRFFPMLMTAAGTVPPAKVLVIGAGVAGLQAIATARRLGAVVQGFDIRPAVKEQVESLGATFVGLAVEEAEAEGGYAKEVGEDVHRREQELLHRLVSGADVVITTAQVPGRPAPRLIPRTAVEAMRPGSVIIDLAAASGGNCELTLSGRTVEHADVRIVGLDDAAAGLPAHASHMYARNVTELLLHLAAEDGGVRVDPQDEITGACLVTHEGRIVNDRVRAVCDEGSP
ncbi:MAG: Re/Si-specific NAD(P)(+) transhydrogenase subunit alpha [Longimicrobiales bacterium]